MSTKRSKKGKGAEAAEGLQISIRPDPKLDTPSYYVNYAAVGHSEYDFVLNVLRIPNQLTIEQTAVAKQGEPVPVEPLLQLILPPRLIDGLINALTEQRRKYEKEFGPIKQERATNETS